ncbi:MULTISPECIES: hypothetical protein [unclassified Lysinibacillus]|uniref:hypothetical protein n=1 Tax=unclassified Lysinibacillus TaxID=2636778 RepID=UPI003828E3B1
MKKLINLLLFAAFFIVGCSSPTPQIHKWDNTKYENFESSIGIDVFNENSYNGTDNDSYKANNTLYISDLLNPITIMFNNNGKNRNFIMNIYYDYQPISFKVTKDGSYEKNYTFSLDDKYEIELPLYLTSDLEKSGAHKLMITFSIAPELHAKNFNKSIDWYGATIIQDIIFDLDNDDFINKTNFVQSDATSELHYSYTLNQDYDYSIMDTGIMPLTPASIKVKPNESFSLMYNVSSPSKKRSKVLLLATLGFNHVPINDSPYLILEVPEKGTVIGKLNFTAPEKPGLYEIISYSVSNPFEKYIGSSHIEYLIESAPRFTLEVQE